MVLDSQENRKFSILPKFAIGAILNRKDSIFGLVCDKIRSRGQIGGEVGTASSKKEKNNPNDEEDYMVQTLAPAPFLSCREFGCYF